MLPNRPALRSRGHRRLPTPSRLRRSLSILGMFLMLSTIAFQAMATATTYAAPGAPPAAPNERAQATEPPATLPEQVATEPPAPTEVMQPTQEVTIAAQPTMPANVTPTPSPTVFNELLGSININYWICPDGYDMASASYTDLQANCTDSQNGIQFTVNASDGSTKSQATGEDNDGTVDFNEVPTGQTTIRQTPAPATASVICKGIVSHGGPETGEMQMPVSMGAITWNLQDDEIVYCDWYTGTTSGPTPTTQGSATTTPSSAPTATAAMTGTGTPENQLVGSVNVEYRECPAAFDPTTATAADLDAQCTGMRNGIQFTVLASDGTTKGEMTGDDADSAVDFGEVPTGQTTISQVPPPGTAAVICKGIVSHGGPETGDMQMTVTNGSVTWDLKDDEIVYCNWYVGAVGGAATGSGTIYINKHGCPAGYDATTPDPYDLAANCNELMTGITFSLTNSSGPIASGATAGSPSAVQFSNVPAGIVTMTESVPLGFGQPIVYCSGKILLDPSQDIPTTNRPVTAGSTTWNVRADEMVFCDWFNIPPPTLVSITIYKFACGGTPQDYMTGGVPDYQKFNSLCTNAMPGVNFTVSNSGGTVATGTTTNSNPMTLANVPVGPVSIAETLPSGYGQPYVYCGPDYANGAQVVTNATINLTLTGTAGIICSWYNVPIGPGSITVYKWACPAGYDYTKPGADPKTECTEALNGVNFTLVDTDPATVDLQTMTGDSIPGAVYFGGEQPGDYTLTETIPDGIASAFVLDCTGGSTGMVHPIPLAVGNVLNLTLGSGDQIVCNWYNVPEAAPDTGALTIHKYICSTTTFVSDIQCETYEQGKTFEVTGGGTALNGTTNAHGIVTWTGVAAGAYTISEVDGQPCAIGASHPDANSNPIDAVNADGTVSVVNGAETVVSVYNCSSQPNPGGKLPNSGKLPTKYPNTGALQTDVIQPEGTPASTPSVADCVPSGTPVASPEPATPETGTPETNGTPTAAQGCGVVPRSIKATAIKVDATIEVRETVDGVMQDPSAPDVVSWYKESALLGAPGNTVMAGHLNYWGVPEGVFFHLAEFKTGDIIEITGEDDNVYRYKVEWVKQVDATQPPTAEILGETDVPSLTLLTCGGPWNADASEYTERTVVRAVLVSAGP